MKSRLQGLIYTFLATLAIYAVIKSNIPKKAPLYMRFLKTVEDLRNDFCQKASSDLQEFYKTTSSDYEYDLEENNELMEKIKKYLLSDTGSLNTDTIITEVKEYFSKSPGYILILVLFIILVLLFIPYLCCSCGKCCSCIPGICLKCPKLQIIIALIFCALALVNCFIGYSENSNIIDGIYGLGCSILKVEEHIVDGDEAQIKKPFWVGINGIIDKLEDINKNISLLKESTSEIRSEYEVQVLPEFPKFREDVENEYEERKEAQVSSPDPNNHNKLVPSYLKEDNYYNYKNALSNIDDEITTYNSLISSNIDTILDYIDEGSKKTEFIKDTIENIRKDILKPINSTSSSIVEAINSKEELLDKIDSYSRKTMNLLFSINLVVVIALGISLILVLFCNFGKCIIIISWILLYVLMLVTFFLGAIFGLVGSFAQDASSNVKYIINNIEGSGLDGVSIDEKVKDIAQICLKGNGSLSQSDIIPQDFGKSVIEKVYSLESFINEKIDLIDNNVPISTTENLKIYNIINTSKIYLKEIIEPLNEVKQYINSSYSDTKLDQASKIYDSWEINKNDCVKDLPLCQKQINYLENTEGQFNCCLIITEWEENDIKNRYDGLKTSDNQNADEIIIEYFKAMKEYLRTSNELVSEIIEKNSVFNTTFIDIGQKVKDILFEIIDLFKPLRQGFDEIVGNDGKSILEILNCNFLKRDSNKIIEELHDTFGQTFKTTSKLFLLISGYELAITVFVMIILKSLGNKDKISSDDIEK